MQKRSFPPETLLFTPRPGNREIFAPPVRLTPHVRNKNQKG